MLKSRITLTIALLLMIGMLLINIVMFMLWQRDALQREVIYARALLDRAVAGISTDRLSADNPAAGIFLADEAGGLLLVTGFEQFSSFALHSSYKETLSDMLAKATSSGREIVRFSGSVWGVFSFRNRVLFVARPFNIGENLGGGIGMIRSLDPLFDNLRQAEKTVLGYLLINVLVLSVIGFFRMRKQVLLPIERLVRLADRYEDKDRTLFAAGSAENEFGRLATSLNSMTIRIEHDRASLQTTVEQLEEANRKLQKNQQEMVRAEKLASVGRLAAGLAHEIGNPLGVVQGYLGLLGRSDDQSNEQLDFIRRADQELQRVNALIRQMLDFARVSKGEPEKFSLHNLLRLVVDMVPVQPVFNDIRLICNLDAGRDAVYADQDRLRQVFVNCLLNSADAVNAAEHGSDCAIAVSTDVYVAQQESKQVEFLRIRISDNGIGIADDQLANIFDPFYTTKEPGKGTGLGLSVSLSIVESMGGKITMESTAGQGSVLSIFLPAAGGDNV